MSDYLAFYDSARLLLGGEYRSLYPLPFVYFSLPLALVNPFIGYLILAALSAVILVYIFKYKSLYWIFYVPVLQCIYLGQVDIIFYLFYYIGSPLTLALATLKPQLFIFAVPKFWQEWNKRNYVFFNKFFAYLMFLYLPFFIVRPNWIWEWLAQIDDGRINSNTSASLSYIFLIGISVIMTLMIVSRKMKIPENNRVIGGIFAFIPAIRPYDYSLLTGSEYLLVPVSWIILGFSQQLHSDWVWGFLGIIVLFGNSTEVLLIQLWKQVIMFIRSSDEIVSFLSGRVYERFIHPARQGEK